MLWCFLGFTVRIEKKLVLFVYAQKNQNGIVIT